jgi:hypothetical protein
LNTNLYLEIIENIARFSLLIPILLFLSSKKQKEKEEWVIFLFLLFSILQQILLVVSFNVLPAFFNFLSFTNPIFYLSFVAVYFRITYKSKYLKKLSLILLFVYVFLQLGPLFLFSSSTATSIATTINTLIILLLCLLFFYEQLQNPKTIFIYFQKSFWGTAAFLMFTAGTFFIFWYNQIPNQSIDFEYQYVVIHACIYILRNLLFSISFIIKAERVWSGKKIITT